MDLKKEALLHRCDFKALDPSKMLDMLVRPQLLATLITGSQPVTPGSFGRISVAPNHNLPDRPTPTLLCGQYFDGQPPNGETPLW